MIDAGFDLLAERFHPILDVFAECGVKFALEVHPTEIAFDLHTAQRALEVLDYRPEFGFNFDPSHLIWQGVNPARFIRKFPDRIFHVHMKDAIVTLDGDNGILASHLNFGDPRPAGISVPWDAEASISRRSSAPSTTPVIRAPCRSNGKTAAWIASTVKRTPAICFVVPVLSSCSNEE